MRFKKASSIDELFLINSMKRLINNALRFSDTLYSCIRTSIPEYLKVSNTRKTLSRSQGSKEEVATYFHRSELTDHE